jgi:hypothetical protein
MRLVCGNSWGSSARYEYLALAARTPEYHCDMGSLGIALLLLCSRSQRLAGISFGAGALLVIGALGVSWYLTDHQKNLLRDLSEASLRYDRTDWQKAVTASPTRGFPANACVVVEFIVESDGHLKLPHVVAGLGPGYDEAVVHTVQHLLAFNPSSIEEGRQVRVMRVHVPLYH